MKTIFVCCLFFAAVSTNGQEQEMVMILEDQARVDEHAENEEDLYQIRQWLRTPLDINRAGRDELAVFPFLTGQQIEQFIFYREMLGPLHHVYELQAVPSWDEGLVRKLLPYIRAGNTKLLRTRLAESMEKGSHQVILRSAMVKNAGFLARYQFNSPLLRYHLNVEKDAGEKLFQPGKGLSFVSANVSLSGVGLVRHVVLGDYLVNMGQGLLLWQGRGIRKTGMTVMIKRQLPTIQNYRSNDENRFMRGAAVMLHKKAVDLSLFLSANKLDANLKTDTVSGKDYVTSILNTGLHRTAGELADKNSLGWVSAGLSASYTRSRLKFGYNEVRHFFPLPLIRSDEPYNKYAIQGRTAGGRSVYYHYSLRNILGFGEVAMDRFGRPALLNGLMFSADSRMDLSILYRNIDRGYRAFGANAFTESADPANEKGIYAGLSFRIPPVLVLDAYADHFRSNWSRYRSTGPSVGSDYFLQLSWRPDKKHFFLIRWKQETKMNDETGDRLIRKNVWEKQTNFRVHLENKISHRVEWRSRIEMIKMYNASGAGEQGFLYFNDLLFKSPQTPVSGNLRLLFYATDGYDSRIYAFENDVMFYNIVSQFYGRGMVFYANFRYAMSDKLNLFIKCSNSRESGKSYWFSRFQLIFLW